MKNSTVYKFFLLSGLLTASCFGVIPMPCRIGGTLIFNGVQVDASAVEVYKFKIVHADGSEYIPAAESTGLNDSGYYKVDIPMFDEADQSNGAREGDQVKILVTRNGASLTVMQPADGRYTVQSAGTLSTVQLQVKETTNEISTQHTMGDYDGDGKADFAVYYMPSGALYISKSSSDAIMLAEVPTQDNAYGCPMALNIEGLDTPNISAFYKDSGWWYILHDIYNGYWKHCTWDKTDIPVPADYDGDGRSDIAAYGKYDGVWHIVRSSDDAHEVFHWGWGDSMPVPGDYDGDGKTDLAVYDSAGRWYIFKSSDQSTLICDWGWGATWPVPGDYDGDGKTDFAVYWPDFGMWYIWATQQGYSTIQWGWRSTIPVPADYNGDGTTDIAVYHQDQGMWYVRLGESGMPTVIHWGWENATPTLPQYWINHLYGRIP
ncbi:MAG: VCBS repeat-containing protein [Spartobacteria bacterium]|nr:VCBS repeat-containing protein [Spartobacteria bacterium]